MKLLTSRRFSSIERAVKASDKRRDATLEMRLHDFKGRKEASRASPSSFHRSHFTRRAGRFSLLLLSFDVLRKFHRLRRSEDPVNTLHSNAASTLLNFITIVIFKLTSFGNDHGLSNILDENGIGCERLTRRLTVTNRQGYFESCNRERQEIEDFENWKILLALPFSSGNRNICRVLL